jgi:maltose alpha-D-glucosyltransferase/alpha-amylase
MTHPRWTSDELLAFLKTKRWFGDKSREIRDARIADEIPVQWPGSDREFVVARVNVDTDAGVSTYQLFLRGDKLGDALEDPAFRRGIADAFVAGAAFENAGTRWIVESESATPLVVPATSPVTLSAAEQTNSSLVIDREAILKLFRRLQPGIHPDVEVTRFLTIERRFPHVPVLLGTVRFEDAGGTTIAGMLQEVVPGAVDGWTHAVQSAREYFAAANGGATDTEPPFAEEAQGLGEVTRALHETLASGDPGSAFEMDETSAHDVRAWARSAQAMIERASRALERALDQKRVPDEQVEHARSIAARRPRYRQWMTELADEIGEDGGAKTRVHGDFHLGQVLRSSAARYLVIDFEGEPSRPLPDRRRCQSPLRDIAGMLRSFAYAAAAGSGPSAAHAAASTKPTTTARQERWLRATRDAFLRGYFADSAGTAALFPRSQSNAGRLISMFKAEKVFYELQYELDHRPDWVWIPLRGIERLYA